MQPYRLKITLSLYLIIYVFFGQHSSVLFASDAQHRALAVTEKNLQDCLATFDSRIGGWCELRVPGRRPGISNVWPKNEARTKQELGATAVLNARGGAAYDSEAKIMYFGGGGAKE